MKGIGSVPKVANALKVLHTSLQAIHLYRDYFRKRILEERSNDNHMKELLERTEI